jgi:hypothetical protein
MRIRKIREWCAELERKRAGQEGVATKESPGWGLFPVLAGIVKLGEAVENGVFDDLFIPMQAADQFERDLAETAIQLMKFCESHAIDLPSGVHRLLTEPTDLSRAPDFDVTEDDVLDILMNDVCYPVFVLWGQLFEREDPELITCLGGYAMLSLLRLAEQLDFDLEAAIDRRLACEEPRPKAVDDGKEVSAVCIGAD